MADEMKLGFVGGGKMSQAMAKAFMKAGLVKPESIIASAVTEKTLDVWKGWGCKTTFSNKIVVQKSQFVFIGVKPYQVLQVMKEVHDNIVHSFHVVVSLANGIKISAFEEVLPNGGSVIRTMPNMSCAIGAGVTAYCRGKNTSEENVAKVHKLLETAGYCVEVKEDYLDIVSALSGSGPAYVFVMISALADGAVKCGLPRQLSQTLATQMIHGASKLVLESGKHPDQLKDEICSPGGSTVVALHEMEKNCFRGTMISAVEAAVNKSKEAGKDK